VDHLDVGLFPLSWQVSECKRGVEDGLDAGFDILGA